MKKLLLAAALLAAASMPTMAETLIDDPLHGFCNGCATNGTNTPILQGGTPLTGFGFNSSPPGLSGTMFLDILIPNNTVIPAGLQVTGFGAPLLFTTGYGTVGVSQWSAATGIAAGQGDNPTLASFLGGSFASGQPDNNLNNFLGATQGLDPGATGFFSLLLNIGQQGPLTGQGTTPSLLFALNNLLPEGSFITAFMLQSNGTMVDTANSSALFVTPNVVQTPVPAAVYLFGTGVLGMLTLMRRRKQRQLPMLSA